MLAEATRRAAEYNETDNTEARESLLLKTQSAYAAFRSNTYTKNYKALESMGIKAGAQQLNELDQQFTDAIRSLGGTPARAPGDIEQQYREGAVAVFEGREIANATVEVAVKRLEGESDAPGLAPVRYLTANGNRLSLTNDADLRDAAKAAANREVWSLLPFRAKAFAQTPEDRAAALGMPVEELNEIVAGITKKEYEAAKSRELLRIGAFLQENAPVATVSPADQLRNRARGN